MAVALVVGAATAQQADLAVALDRAGGVIRVRGKLVAEALRTRPADELVRVFVAEAGAEAPAVGGSYAGEGDAIVFTPRFPFEPGIAYRVEWDEGAATMTVRAGKVVPGGTTAVARIYPTADALPENLLKFYLHFTAPMSRGEAYSRVKLLDESGKAVEAPFLELDQELWDSEGRRFTLFFDPGRIKREVTPNMEAGLPLKAGRSYTLVVSREWKDAKSSPLRREARKTFRVVPADRTPIDLKTWRIAAPTAGSRGALEVRLGEPVDHALADWMIEVMGSDGPLPGRVELTESESVWRFVPDVAWKAGNHQLRVAVTLEDLAGNKVGRAFDVDVFQKVEKLSQTRKMMLPFRVDAPR